MAKLSDYFSRSMIGEFSDDFWDNPVYEGAEKGSACYGREGCRQAYKYILDKGDDADPAVAKEIAATYCAYHADQCDDDRTAAHQAVAGDGRDHRRDHAGCRQEDDVNLGVAEKPEQMLP